LAITVPTTLEGYPLSSKQRARLQDILDAIEKVNPGRSKNSIVFQAVGSFKLTAKLVNGSWVDEANFRLSNGRGPIVVPSWSSPSNVQ
jgi:hypothetical protein